MVVLEDVDLVATERTMPGAGTNPLLFQLLNEMDGLAEDVDVVFVLTTNRVDLLEPALAARPGRIDQAVEIPLPDQDCRRRLLDLYLRGLDHDVDDLDDVVARTEGVTASFIKELVRRAVLHAADTTPDAGSPGVRLGLVDLVDALDDLLEHSRARAALLARSQPTPRRPPRSRGVGPAAPTAVGGWTAFGVSSI